MLMNMAPNLLVYFVVFMMLVHSPDIIQSIFVQNFPQLFILNVEQTEQKFCCLDWKQYIFGPENHDSSNTFLPDVGMQIRSMVFEDIDDLNRDEG